MSPVFHDGSRHSRCDDHAVYNSLAERHFPTITHERARSQAAGVADQGALMTVTNTSPPPCRASSVPAGRRGFIKKRFLLVPVVVVNFRWRASTAAVIKRLARAIPRLPAAGGIGGVFGRRKKREEEPDMMVVSVSACCGRTAARKVNARPQQCIGP